MNKQRKVLITITYNEMGIIIDTKAEEVAQPNLQPTCNQLATDTISRQAAITAICEDGTWLERQGCTEITMAERKQRDADILSALPSFSRDHAYDRSAEPCEDVVSRQAAIDAGLRLCGMDTKMELIDLCEASIADSEGRAGAILDYIGELEDLPSAQPERTCLNCGRTANNGGWYADGRTRCPIEEHYALPKDGYCHLWEKRNVTDDDYPERREE